MVLGDDDLLRACTLLLCIKERINPCCYNVVFAEAKHQYFNRYLAHVMPCIPCASRYGLACAGIECSSLAHLATALDAMADSMDVKLDMVPRIRFGDHEWFPEYTTIDNDMFVSLSGSVFRFAAMVSGSMYGIRGTKVFDALKRHRLSALYDTVIPPSGEETTRLTKHRRKRAKAQAKALDALGDLPNVIDVKVPSPDGDPFVMRMMITTSDAKAQVHVQLNTENMNYIIDALRREAICRESNEVKRVRKRPDSKDAKDIAIQHRISWDTHRLAWIARARGKCHTFRPLESETKDEAYGRATAWIKSLNTPTHVHEDTQDSACTIADAHSTPSCDASGGSQSL